MTERAYATFQIKSINDDQRLIEGIASTPTLDRQGDEMDSKGAQFVLPMPLKWQHKNAVGQVIAASVTEAGILIRAILPKIAEPGLLKEQVDYAWQSIKFGLTRGLSIGWRPIDAKFNRDTGGMKVSKWEWFETSAVDIPANAEATITAIKSYDTMQEPALRPAASLPSAGVSAPPRPAGRGGLIMKQVNEQIAELQTSRRHISDRMKALMEPVLAAEGDLDATQKTEYDGLATQLKGVDERLERLTVYEQSQIPTLDLKGVSGQRPQQPYYPHVSVTEPELPPGIAFTRAAMCKILARMDMGASGTAWDIAKKRYPSHPSISQYLEKTAILAGTTTGTGSGSPQSGWGDDLAALNTNFNAGFMAYLRPQTIIGRLPGLTRAPFNVRIQSQTTGGSAQWVGQGKAKPVTKYDFDAITLGFAKVAGICVLAEELIRFSTPNAETIVRDQLARTLIDRLDQDFIDPDVAAVANVSPASITRGATVLTPSGTNLAAVIVDVENIVGRFISANQDLSQLAWIMTNTTALALSMMLTSLGNRAFPDITTTGGTFVGYPVITSQWASGISTSPTKGNLVILINQKEIFLADDGAVSIDASNQASIEMSDNPEVDTGIVQSMFQTNCVALRAERFINWARGRSTSVYVMGNVLWA